MKKRNNKIIVLVLIAIIFLVSLLIFILNYSKDDSSFSILEKKWINDNASNVIDISVYNDIPVYGNNGKGVIFDLLDDFTTTYGINFNKISYSVENKSSLKENAFKVISNNTALTDKDILLYEDNYVLVGTKKESIDTIYDMDNLSIGVLSSDMGIISNSLTSVKNISYIQKETIEEIESAIKNEEIEYTIIPYNMYMDLNYIPFFLLH